MAQVEDDPTYGGVLCTKSVCGWQGTDMQAQRCPRCGNWTRVWITNVPELIPSEVIEAHRRSGEPLVPLPDLPDDKED